MLISFEGIDGSGKSTQVALLKQRLEAQGYVVDLVREPGGTPLSERIRTLLLDPALVVDPMTELLLFSASRAQLVREHLQPSLAKGNIVICDRFFDSTTVYQGAGRGLDRDGWLDGFNRRVTGGLVPSRTYLIDMDPDEALRRRAARGGKAARDRMEQADPEFYARIVNAYRALARAEPARWCVIDGRRSIEEIAQHVWSDLNMPANHSRNTPR
ncbi:MAG: dTMP kinase [Rhodothermales bacterium]|mgnify:CR=1 FL=1|nr:dTMP kinase [Rhodothermales bacterium]